MKITKEMKKSIVNSIMADLKFEDYTAQAQSLIQKDAISKLPKELLEHKHFLATKYVHVHKCYCMRVAVTNNQYEIPNELSEKVKALHDKHEQQNDARNQIERELYVLIHNCNTDKQLKTVMPENLHKYIPKETDKPTQSTALVSESLVNKIEALGFK